jgi:hypothetical protein
MDDKEAAKILLELVDRYSLSGEDKEAVLNAVGVLGWTSLGKSRLKAMGKARQAKRRKSEEW